MTRFSEPSLYRIKYNALDPSSLETSETNMKNGSSILSYKYSLQVCQRVCSKSLFLNEFYADEYQMVRTPQTHWGNLHSEDVPAKRRRHLQCQPSRVLHPPHAPADITRPYARCHNYYDSWTCSDLRCSRYLAPLRLHGSRRASLSLLIP